MIDNLENEDGRWRCRRRHGRASLVAARPAAQPLFLTARRHKHCSKSAAWGIGVARVLYCGCAQPCSPSARREDENGAYANDPSVLGPILSPRLLSTLASHDERPHDADPQHGVAAMPDDKHQCFDRGAPFFCIVLALGQARDVLTGITWGVQHAAIRQRNGITEGAVSTASQRLTLSWHPA